MKIAMLLLCLPLTPFAFGQKELPDYRSTNLGWELPMTAEKLLLERVRARKIVDLRALVFERSGADDYLGVSASFEIDWGFERVYHPRPYVLKKASTDKDWSSAKLYQLKDGELRQLFGKPERDWSDGLELIKPAK